MKRLTMEKGLCAKVSTDYCHQHKDCYECGHGREVFRKLAAYEDTGLTPEEIEDLLSVREISPEAEYAINKHADNLIERLDKLIKQTDEENELQRYKKPKPRGELRCYSARLVMWFGLQPTAMFRPQR